MKYFTYELWRNAGNPDEEIRKQADLEWEKNDEAYSKVFDEISKKLPKSFVKIYLENKGFHDYYLEKVEIADTGGFRARHRPKYSVEVNLSIKYFDDQWRITYKNVKNISIVQPKEGMFDKWAGFDDWGYDEFSMIDNKTFTHEILFASGYSILIYFEDISIEKIS